MIRWQEARRAVLEAAQRMVKQGLVVGTAGNVSLRLEPEAGRELLAITPNHRYYDSLEAESIVVIDFEGEPVEGELAPSIETTMHVAIYRARPDVSAIVHTHSPLASALAVAGVGIPSIIDEQVVYLGGEIGVAQHAMPGSQELAKNAVVALGEKCAVLLANHGVVGVGRDMREAFTTCELVEQLAMVYVAARCLGQVHTVPREALEAEQAFFAMLRGKVR